MHVDSFSARLGLLVGYPLWATTSFGIFHALNYLGLLDNEGAWAAVQLATAAIGLVCALRMFQKKARGRKVYSQPDKGAGPP